MTPSNPNEVWLEPRNFALRPLYWEISSDAYIAEGQRSMECFGVRRCEMECHDWKGRAQGLRRHVVLAGIPKIVPTWAV